MRKFITIILCIGLCFMLMACSSVKSHEDSESAVETKFTESSTQETSASSTESFTTSEPDATSTTSNGKVYVKTAPFLSHDEAEGLVKSLIKEYYNSYEDAGEFEFTTEYIFNESGSIQNERIKTQLESYIADSASYNYFSTISEFGTYFSVTGLSEYDIVFFEMDNGHIAISEPDSNISDYSMRYKFLFTFRNSDATTAYYWCAQEESSELVSYASHRVERIWVYNTNRNTYSCIFEKE